MNNISKIELLREVEELINELKGLDDFDFRKSGISAEECLNPTEETVHKLRNYYNQKNNNNIDKLDF